MSRLVSNPITDFTHFHRGTNCAKGNFQKIGFGKKHSSVNYLFDPIGIQWSKIEQAILQWGLIQSDKIQQNPLEPNVIVWIGAGTELLSKGGSCTFPIIKKVPRFKILILVIMINKIPQTEILYICMFPRNQMCFSQRLNIFIWVKKCGNSERLQMFQISISKSVLS